MNTITSPSQSDSNITIYKIGKTVFSLDKSVEIPIPENLTLFAYEGECIPSVHYQMRTMSFNQERIGKICEEFAPTREIHREDRLILQNGNRKCRLLYFHGANQPYGVYLENSMDSIEILVDESVVDMLVYDTIFLSLFALEKQMLRENALILHCAYMFRNGKAILFSAPSGTGKSTQADLWEKYRGTRTINGDKALIYRHEDGWYAHGWPICGSSEICHNEEYPIEAIVMLHQAKENSIETLTGLTIVKKLMAQITINMWNSNFQMQAMDLIDQMAEELQVYELGCEISEAAVECLEKILNQ